MTKKPKVALGMSGGVDSSICAHLLVEQGFDVTGVYLECWSAPGCRTEEDRQDALKVALSLNIPFKVLDFKKAYHDKVVANFFDEYKAGRTPNPDVLCNKEIKFGLFYNWAMENNFDSVATGHYAKIEKINFSYFLNNELHLTTPEDGNKDQTYFLHLLTAKQLEHIIFPLADLKKSDVRKIANQKKLHNAQKKDSVGICFIGDIDTHQFIKEKLGINPGEVIDVSGTVIGRHQGLWFYTIGQRHGFQIYNQSLVLQSDGNTISKHNIPPFYVIEKKPKNNQLVVGFGKQTFKKLFKIKKLHLIRTEYQSLLEENELFVRIRHQGKLIKSQLHFIDQTNKKIQLGLQVELEHEIQGLAEGQSAVFYLPNQSTNLNSFICFGGGVIELS